MLKTAEQGVGNFGCVAWRQVIVPRLAWRQSDKIDAMAKSLTCIICIILCCALPTPVAAQQEVRYWSPDNGGNGHWYAAYLQSGEQGWNSARDQAQARGGDLACLTSADELDFAIPLIQDPALWTSRPHGWYGPWIGLFQSRFGIEPGGGWEWVDGERLIFENWQPGAPDELGDAHEDYGQFKGASGIAATWNDLPQTGELGTALVHSFLAEFERPTLQAERGSGARDFKIEGRWAAPSGRVLIAVGASAVAAGTGVHIPACPGLRASIEGVLSHRAQRAAIDGSFDFYGAFPEWSSGKLVYLQAIDVEGCRLSRVLPIEIP